MENPHENERKGRIFDENWGWELVFPLISGHRHWSSDAGTPTMTAAPTPAAPRGKTPLWPAPFFAVESDVGKLERPRRKSHWMSLFSADFQSDYIDCYVLPYQVANGVCFIPCPPAPSLHCEANQCESPWTSARDGEVSGTRGIGTKPQSLNCEGGTSPITISIKWWSKPIQTHPNPSKHPIKMGHWFNWCFPAWWPKIVLASSAIPSWCNFT